MVNLSNIKIILLGEANSGKSELFQQIKNEPFNDHYSATIGVEFIIKRLSSDKPFQLQIYDTTGQERFRPLIDVYKAAMQIGIICIDLSEHKLDFGRINKEIRDLKSFSPACRIILVGTKSDLCLEQNIDPDAQLAKIKNDNISWKIATSAKKRQGILNEGGLLDIIGELLKSGKQSELSPPDKGPSRKTTLPAAFFGTPVADSSAAQPVTPGCGMMCTLL